MYIESERSSRSVPAFIRQLFEQLRRRRFPLGVDDYFALQQALGSGFGWSSYEALRDVCCALWAKSQQERDIVVSLFDQLHVPVWDVSKQESTQSASLAPEPLMKHDPDPYPVAESSPKTQAHSGLPPISVDGVVLSKRSFIFVPQLPLTYREVAQICRRLRRPVREGPATELDIEATIAHRCRSGTTSSVVLRPRRRNKARMLLLVDRQGSMVPFHRLCQEVSSAIEQAGRFESVGLYYFHDVPSEGADETLLASFADQLFPALDPVLSQIQPLENGSLYTDPEMFFPQSLRDVLQMHAEGAHVVVFSDGGAARGRYDILRLLDTIAFMKALRTYTHHSVWLNPLPRSYWTRKTNTAVQIARHVPMFPIDQDGLYRAVNVLRGQPFLIERPL